MPQYAALTFTDDVDWTAPEQAGEMAEWNEFRDAAMPSSGAAPRCTRRRRATTVRVSEKGGEVLTTDGPYAETKEALTGFYLLECADLDEAIAWAAKIPAAWGGAVEVRPVIDFGAADARVTAHDEPADARPWPSWSARRAATSSPPSPAGPATSRSPRTPSRTRRVRALETWPRDGVPDEPGRLAAHVARRRAVDLIRREAARGDKEAAAMQVVHPRRGAGAVGRRRRPAAAGLHLLPPQPGARDPGGPGPAHAVRPDHPEVARALLVSEASMAKRLTRARQKIQQAHIPYRVPADHELPAAAGRRCSRRRTWSSTRGTPRRPVRGWCATSSSTRRSGWPGCSSGCVPTTPGRPGCWR